MVSPRAASALGDMFGDQPTGTGFMILDEWVEGDHIALRRNEDYVWGPPAFAKSGPADLSRMTFRLYQEESERLAAFKAGEVDILDRVQPRDIAVLGDERPYRKLNATALGVPISLVLNSEASPTDELAVRQALNFALDREQIVSFAFRGASQPARGPLAPETPFASEVPTATLPYDPDFAASLLDAAGWITQDSGIREKNGEQLVLRWAIGPWDAHWAELAQAQFSQLGAVVQIVQMEETEFSEAMRRGDINMMSTAIPGSDPIVLGQLFEVGGSVATATPVSASSPGLDSHLYDGATASSEREREDSYARAQALIMDEALIVPVALVPEIVVVATEIAGVRRDFRNGLWLHDAVLRKSDPD
jgi:peptide/nickel transport system substrate-binding protein